MNLFRSEEHLRRWEGWDEDKSQGLISLDAVLGAFSQDFFKRRGDPDYFSKMGEYFEALIPIMNDLDEAGAYWRPGRVAAALLPIAKKLGIA